MIKVTNEMKQEVKDYLGDDYDGYTDEFYSFYHRGMKAGMHYSDADRYAILNTLLNYDIGMDNARAIDSWMYEHDEDIYELDANEDSKEKITLAANDLGLNIDFSGWCKENYTEYKFFEK